MVLCMLFHLSINVVINIPSGTANVTLYVPFSFRTQYWLKMLLPLFPFAVWFWYVSITVQEICNVNLISDMQVETHVFVLVFSTRRSVLVFSIIAFSPFANSYFRFPHLHYPRMHIWCCLYFHFPYLHNPPSVTYVFHTCIFSPPLPISFFMLTLSNLQEIYQL